MSIKTWKEEKSFWYEKKKKKSAFKISGNKKVPIKDKKKAKKTKPINKRLIKNNKSKSKSKKRWEIMYMVDLYK